MRPEIVNDLVCPSCRGPLRLRADETVGDEVETGALLCGCGRVHPIRQGIPRLLPERLAPLDARIAAAFSYEWTHFRIDYDGVAAHFREWVAPLKEADFAGKRVVDAGCGMGRHAREAARLGAARVYALDLSEAVRVARDYVREEKCVHVLQADLRHPPLRGDIDLVYSIGVLNQLPDPQEGFSALARLLRPKGTLYSWVYAAEAGRLVTLLIDPLRAHVTSRLPFPVLRVLTWPSALLLWMLSRGIYRPIGARWPAMRRHLPWSSYLEQLGGFPLSLLHCTLFDQLVAPAATYCRRDELRRYLERAGLRNVLVIPRHANGWRGLGRAG